MDAETRIEFVSVNHGDSDDGTEDRLVIGEAIVHTVDAETGIEFVGVNHGDSDDGTEGRWYTSLWSSGVDIVVCCCQCWR